MTSDYLKRWDVQGHLKVMEALRKWDPIGIFKVDPAWPQDEYDAYSGPVVSMLDAGSPKEKIVKYLEEICVQRIEMPFDRARTERIVDELLEWWPQWKSELKRRDPRSLIDEEKA